MFWVWVGQTLHHSMFWVGCALGLLVSLVSLLAMIGWYASCLDYAHRMVVRGILVKGYARELPGVSLIEHQERIRSFISDLDKIRPLGNPPPFYDRWVRLFTARYDVF